MWCLKDIPRLRSSWGPQRMTRRAGAALVVLWILAMALNPLLVLALTAGSGDQMLCTDHACCRRGPHGSMHSMQSGTESRPQVRGTNCPGCCAFGQIVVLKLAPFLPATPQIATSLASQPAVRAQVLAALTPVRNTALFSRPPPAL